MTADIDDLHRLKTARPTRSARWIAGALTPANVVLALMAYVTVKHTDSWRSAAGWWLLALVLVVGVPYLILFRALRTGQVDDRQVVRRSQRPALFAAAAAAVAAGLLALHYAKGGSLLCYNITTAAAVGAGFGAGTLGRTGAAAVGAGILAVDGDLLGACLLYTSPSPRDGLLSRMPSSA